MSSLLAWNKGPLSTTADFKLNGTRLTTPQEKWELAVPRTKQSWFETEDLIAYMTVLAFYNQETQQEVEEVKARLGAEGVWAPQYLGATGTAEEVPRACLLANHAGISQFLRQLRHLTASKQASIAFLEEKAEEIEQIADNLRGERAEVLAQLNHMRWRNVAGFKRDEKEKFGVQFTEFLERELRDILRAQIQKNEILAVKLSKMKAKRSTIEFKTRLHDSNRHQETGRVRQVQSAQNSQRQEVETLEQKVREITANSATCQKENVALTKEKAEVVDKIAHINSELRKLRASMEGSEGDIGASEDRKSANEARIIQITEKRMEMKKDSVKEIEGDLSRESAKRQQWSVRAQQISDRLEELQQIQSKASDEMKSLQTALKEARETGPSTPPPTNSDPSAKSARIKLKVREAEYSRHLETLKEELKHEGMVRLSTGESKNQLLRNKIKVMREIIAAHLKGNA